MADLGRAVTDQYRALPRGVTPQHLALANQFLRASRGDVDIGGRRPAAIERRPPLPALGNVGVPPGEAPREIGGAAAWPRGLNAGNLTAFARTPPGQALWQRIWQAIQGQQVGRPTDWQSYLRETVPVGVDADRVIRAVNPYMTRPDLPAGVEGRVPSQALRSWRWPRGYYG